MDSRALGICLTSEQRSAVIAPIVLFRLVHHRMAKSGTFCIPMALLPAPVAFTRAGWERARLQQIWLIGGRLSSSAGVAGSVISLGRLVISATLRRIREYHLSDLDKAGLITRWAGR